MKSIILFSNCLPKLLPIATAAGLRFPHLEFDTSSEIDRLFRKLKVNNFLAMVVYLDPSALGDVSFLKRLRRDPAYRKLPVVVYKELPTIDALAGFLESM